MDRREIMLKNKQHSVKIDQCRIRPTPQEDNSPPYKFWSWAPLHKTIVSLQLMVSLQTMVSAIDFLILIGYGAVLLW